MVRLTNTTRRYSNTTHPADDCRPVPDGSPNARDARRDEAGAELAPLRQEDAAAQTGDGLELLESSMPVGEYGDAILGLFEQSGIGLAILNLALRVQFVNEAFTQRCGRDDIHGRSIAEFIHPSVREHLMRQFERVAKGQRARLIGRSTKMWFMENTAVGNLSVFPVDDNDGKTKMLLVLFTPEKSDGDRLSRVDVQRKLTSLTAKVLEGVAAGDSTVHLATKLFLSRQGIEYHVSILLRQFKVPNRTALVAKAYSIGMFSIGAWPPRVLPDYIRDTRPAAAATSSETVYVQRPPLATVSAQAQNQHRPAIG